MRTRAPLTVLGEIQLLYRTKIIEKLKNAIGLEKPWEKRPTSDWASGQSWSDRRQMAFLLRGSKRALRTSKLNYQSLHGAYRYRRRDPPADRFQLRAQRYVFWLSVGPEVV